MEQQSTKYKIREIYNSIAYDFDHTRYKIWPKIQQFLDNIPSHNKVLELGSGNGKHLIYRKDLDMLGLDISDKLVEISKSKGANVILGDMCKLPFNNNSYDYIISVASYHHLDNEKDRKDCISEIARVLKPNGLVFMQVFSMNQEPDSKFKFTKNDNLITWTKRITGEVFERYYRAYNNKELDIEVENYSNNSLECIDSGWEKGNNWAIFIKK